MSIEHQEQIKQHLNEVLGLMNKAVANLDMNDTDEVEQLIKSIREATEAVKVRETDIYLSFAANPNKNVI